MGPNWIELERNVVAASLSELTVPAAIAAMCESLTSCGIACALLDAGEATIVPGGGAATEGAIQVPVRRSEEGGFATLVVEPGHGLSSSEVARVVRLFEVVFQASQPISQGALVLHRLRNRLAGVMGNIEFAEMALSEAVRFAQRDEILAALRHARRSCREMAASLHSTDRKPAPNRDDV